MALFIKLIMPLSVVGIADTLYLSYCKLAKRDVYCLFFPDEWCKKVQYSKYSKTFGIPNSFLGLGVYLVILVLSLSYLSGTVPIWPLQIVIGFGFLFAMYFTYIQAFVLRAFCTWCVLSAIVLTLMAYAVFFLS